MTSNYSHKAEDGNGQFDRKNIQIAGKLSLIFINSTVTQRQPLHNHPIT